MKVQQVLGLGVWFSAFAAARLLQPVFEPLGPLVGYPVSFLLCAGGALVGTGLVLREPPVGAAAWATAGFGAAAYVLANGVLGDSGPGHLVGSTALVVLAMLLGRAIAERIEKASHLLPAALVVAAADTWSVLAPSGVSAQLLERPELLPLVVLTFPVVGGQGYAPLLGAADICIAALFLHVGARFDLPRRRTAWALALALVVTVVLVMALAVPVPALPFIAGGFVAAHWRKMRLSKSEWLLVAGFVAVVAGIGLGLGWVRG